MKKMFKVRNKETWHYEDAADFFCSAYGYQQFEDNRCEVLPWAGVLNYYLGDKVVVNSHYITYIEYNDEDGYFFIRDEDGHAHYVYEIWASIYPFEGSCVDKVIKCLGCSEEDAMRVCKTLFTFEGD